MIELRAAGGERREEERDLGRVVLAVGVERDDRHGAVLECVPEPGPERRTLARRSGAWTRTVAPAASALAAVSSVDPSSTTTTGRNARAASTTAPMRGPSW